MFFLDYTPELNETEIEIYKYINHHLSKVLHMTIREIANNTHTSTASISRFCRKFKCHGYSEFKIKLRMYYDSLEQPINYTKDVSMLIDFLRRTSSPHYQECIYNAVQLLKDKELVLFVGAGPSAFIASYGAMYFSSFFGMSMYMNEIHSHSVNYLSPELSKKTCLVVLSVSGENSDILDYMQHPNFSSSHVLSITNSANSTIAKLSNVNIPYYINLESVSGYDKTSQLPALYTLELLAKETREYLEEYKQAK